jgi:hypothetical protein
MEKKPPSLANALSQQHRLLLQCALYPLRDDEIASLRGACQGLVDWSNIPQQAARHNLSGLLYANLKQHAADRVPPPILSTLKTQAEQNRRHVFGLLAELNAVSTVLAPAGIKLCPLKGPLLSQQLYGDVALRVTHDLDLLFDEAQLDNVEERLQQAGYQRIKPLATLTPLQWRTYRRIVHHVVYDHPERKAHLEIHWTLATPELIPQAFTQQFLARAHPFASNPALLSLTDEDLLCYLIIHGARHGWAQFKWLADIAMFLRQSPGPDWQVVRQQMAALDLLHPLGQALLLARTWFDAPIPVSLEPLLTEPPVQLLAQQAQEIALSEHGFAGKRGNFQRLRSLLYRSNIKASWLYKLNTWSQIGIIEDDLDDLRLPDWLFPLYFVLRPFLWLRRYHLPRNTPKDT